MSDAFGNAASGAASGAAMGTMVSPGMGTAIGAGVGALGSIVGGLIGQSGQAAANAQQFQQQEMLFNQQQASIPAAQIQAEQNAWAMRGNAYQTTMADMKAAGLNPILAANLGANTSGITGGISASVPQSSPVGNAGAMLGQGVASASQAGAQFLQLQALGKQAEKDASQASLNEKSGNVADATEARTRAETANVEKTGRLTDQNVETGKSAARANDASAASSLASAALDAAKTVEAQHNARRADADANIRQAEWNRVNRIGPQPQSTLGANWYDLKAQASDLAQGVVNIFKGVHQPGSPSATPAIKPPSQWQIFKGSK